MAFGRKKDDGEGQPLESYKVSYRGGLSSLPKAKTGEIALQFWSDRFELRSTLGSKKWWSDLVIPYDTVREIAVVDRQVSTFEALAGGLDSKQLNQKNNIHITYTADAETVLRLEMLSGMTVQSQAKKCLEMQDRLRVHAIPEQFASSPAVSAADAPGSSAALEQIRQLSELHGQGVLTDEEYTKKKTELLDRM